MECSITGNPLRGRFFPSRELSAGRGMEEGSLHQSHGPSRNCSRASHSWYGRPRGRRAFASADARDPRCGPSAVGAPARLPCTCHAGARAGPARRVPHSPIASARASATGPTTTTRARARPTRARAPRRAGRAARRRGAGAAGHIVAAADRGPCGAETGAGPAPAQPRSSQHWRSPFCPLERVEETSSCRSS